MAKTSGVVEKCVVEPYVRKCRRQPGPRLQPWAPAPGFLEAQVPSEGAPALPLAAHSEPEKISDTGK